MAMHTGRETWKASATKSTQYTGVIRGFVPKVPLQLWFLIELDTGTMWLKHW